MFDLPPKGPRGSKDRQDRGEAQRAESLLAGLRDLDGVWGAFVVSLEGELIVWDVPSSITEPMLDAVAPRLTVLREAFASGGNIEADVITLRFDQHRLTVGAAPFGLVCAITTPAINGPALRMALHVTTRRLARMFESAIPAGTRDH
jgi:predicted regulator of Ras-like GTPase activity (Roadblock/LC7/MglB family)